MDAPKKRDSVAKIHIGRELQGIRQKTVDHFGIVENEAKKLTQVGIILATKLRRKDF